jgi:hypothetical protein
MALNLRKYRSLRRHSGESRNPGFKEASAARPILDAKCQYSLA